MSRALGKGTRSPATTWMFWCVNAFKMHEWCLDCSSNMYFKVVSNWSCLAQCFGTEKAYLSLNHAPCAPSFKLLLFFPLQVLLHRGDSSGLVAFACSISCLYPMCCCRAFSLSLTCPRHCFCKVSSFSKSFGVQCCWILPNIGLGGWGGVVKFVPYNAR